MPVFNASNANANVLVGNLQQALRAHQKALDTINSLYAWASGLAAADLVAVGFSAIDATAFLSAIADAHAEYLIHTTGLPPSTYPQPASAYPYAASQNAVVGPTIGPQ